MLHLFPTDISEIPLPGQFTNPFHYIPHPLCELAADEVQSYLKRQTVWQTELEKGKMFGVLVVKDKAGQLGYLVAFSGLLAGSNIHPWFVPPIYDLQESKGFFKAEEEQISAINVRIKILEESSDYLHIEQALAEEEEKVRKELDEAKAALNEAKENRDARRRNNPTEKELAEMIRESQAQNARYKLFKQSCQTRIDRLSAEADVFRKDIKQLKDERKERSAALQQKLFTQFSIRNAHGHSRSLLSIFSEAGEAVPPAGAGECAGPRLLQYAYLNELKPLAMAEFWWGNSPKSEIRRQGYFYPACKSKCQPILNYMLRGLDVAPNSLDANTFRDKDIEVCWEDEWLLVVNKPAGMLSVPGKGEVDSIYSRLQTRYPEATGPMIVHRLDMATSGLLLVAKTKAVHQNLQAQFANRTIRKCYIALLDGIITEPKKGTIELPVCPDITDRPWQMVSMEYGKPAVTDYEILGYEKGRFTRIAFYPRTGRTHQLRVHAAHSSGLNTPIVGDELYGKAADRLYLHAESLVFRHPVTGASIRVEKKAF